MKKILFGASVYHHLKAFHIPFMQWFQEQGYEVHAVASDSLGGRDAMVSMGIVCHDVHFDRMPVSQKNILAMKQLKQLFQIHHYELIHVHTPTAAFLIRYLAKQFKQGKIVYTAHGFHFFQGAPKQNWLIYYTAEKLAAKWTDHLITINDEDYQRAQKLFPASNTSFVHGVGVELAVQRLTEKERLALKTQLKLKPDSIVISYIAELNNNKNHQFLLNNWQKIKQQNQNFELLIIGAGENESQLKAFIESRGIEGVHFLGFRQDVPMLLQITDIVALLSHREGLPKSIMEAMAAGLPCVVTNTRGLRDLVLDGENGYVVNHGNDEKLVDAFVQLGYSLDKRIQMGNRAKELVKPFEMQNVLKEYTEIYERLLP